MVFAFKDTRKFRLNDTYHITNNQKQSMEKVPMESVVKRHRITKMSENTFKDKVMKRFNIKIFLLDHKQKFTSWLKHTELEKKK